MFVTLNDVKKGIYGIVGLRVGVCSQLAICERVEEFSVCRQSGNEECFEEFSEGVIEIYASVGCWVYFVLAVSSVDRFIRGS